MRNTFFMLTLIASITLAALAQQAKAPDPKARAQEVLKQARIALWDESKSKALESVSITANVRTAMGEREAISETTLDVLLPDKFLRTEVSQSFDTTTIMAINGKQIWSSNPTVAALMMGGGPGGGDDGGGGGGAIPPPPPGGGGGGGDAVQGGGPGRGGARGRGPGQFNAMSGNPAEFGRLVLAWLMITPATLPVEFTYAGEANADGKTADVIDAKGPNNFTARLFIDRTTHQLLLMTYKARSMPFRGLQGPGQGNRNAGGNRPTPEEMEKMRAAMANPPEVETRWYLSDYRNVNGLNLPHRIVKKVDTEVNEQIDVKKVKINPEFKPDKFEKKEEKK
jgi:hypothetical protein